MNNESKQNIEPEESLTLQAARLHDEGKMTDLEFNHLLTAYDKTLISEDDFKEIIRRTREREQA